MHINDTSAFNCRGDLTGKCVGLLFLSLKTTENQDRKWHLLVLTKKKYSRDINCISVLQNQPTDWSLLPTSHISRSKVWNKIYIFIYERGN